MKISTPIITLLGGTALGVAVLVASIVQTPSGAAPVNYSATSAASAGSGTNGSTARARAPASPPAVTSRPASSTASSTPSPSAIPTTPPPVPGPVPTNANYASQVNGGGGAAGAVSV